MDSDKKTGIQISQKADAQDVSFVGGGIKILASEKSIAAGFFTGWGNIYILLDCSGSMKGHKIEQAKQGISDFAKDAFKKEYRVGLIRFSDDAELLSEPVNEIVILQDHFKGLRAGGATNLTAAVTLTHLKLKGLANVRVMVIATDGMPGNTRTSLEAAAKAKAEGIEILTIGTDDADKAFLKKLASREELSAKVSNEKFAQAISNASLLLMGSRSLRPK